MKTFIPTDLVKNLCQKHLLSLTMSMELKNQYSTHINMRLQAL